MKQATSPPLSTPIQPEAILAGLGHGSRHELCNLIALLDASSSLELLIRRDQEREAAVREGVRGQRCPPPEDCHRAR
jgi:hypothetical protein